MTAWKGKQTHLKALEQGPDRRSFRLATGEGHGWTGQVARALEPGRPGSQAIDPQLAIGDADTDFAIIGRDCV